jgi:hypothetical protein
MIPCIIKRRQFSQPLHPTIEAKHLKNLTHGKATPQKVKKNIHQHEYSSLQLMNNVEIASYVQHCIIFINDILLFDKKFINGPSCGQYILAPSDQFLNHCELIQIVNSQITTL